MSIYPAKKFRVSKPRFPCYMKLCMKWRLVHISTRRCLTPFGMFCAALFLLLILSGLLAGLYPFLAPDHPPHQGILVIEGWIDDPTLEKALDLYRQGKHKKIICTGIPLETGSFLAAYKTYPEMTAARLVQLGVSADQIHVPVTEPVITDRTYRAACALHRLLEKEDFGITNLHLVTTGPHGRRSLFLYRKALGNNYSIGITSLPDTHYDPARWYACSEGVRAVISESIAYLYAKLLFHP